MAATFSADGGLTLTASRDGNIQAWLADLSNSVLRRKLWYATRSCPSVEDRVEHLSIDRDTAKINEARCEAMIRCAYARERRDFDRCLAEFRRAQRTGEAFHTETP